MIKFIFIAILTIIWIDIAYATPASIFSYAVRFSPIIICVIFIIAVILWLIFKSKKTRS